MRTRALLAVLVALGVAACDGDEPPEPAAPAAEAPDARARALVRALGYGGEPEPVPTGPHRVTGVVRDREGRPVAGIEVHAKTEAGGAPRLFRTVRTDARGRYTLEEVPAGWLWVGVESWVDLREPWALHVDVQGDIAHDLVLAGGFGLSGWIEAPEGGAVVVALARQPTPQHAWSRELAGSGRFAFRGLLPGAYRLRVTSERHGTVQRDLEVYGDVFGLTVDLRRAVRLAGAFAPQYPFDVQKVRYELRCDSAGYADAAWTSTLEFAWEQLPPGEYEVRVRHQAFQDQRSSVRTFAWRLDGTASRSDLVLAIPPGREVSVGLAVDEPRPGSEGEVRVESADGLELASARVRLLGDGPEGGGRFGRWAQELYFPPSFVEFDRLDLAGVAEVSLTLCVRLEGYGDVVASLPERGDVAPDVELEAVPGRRVTFDVPYEHLRVDVRPAAGGAWREWIDWDDRSKASHAYAVGSKEGFLPPGEHELRVLGARRVGPVVLPVTIEDSSEPLVLAPALAPGLAIRATLVDVLGRPLRTPVYLHRREGLEWTFLRERSDQTNVAPNAHEFRGLSPGAYRLALDPAGEIVLDDVVLEGRDLRLELRY